MRARFRHLRGGEGEVRDLTDDEVSESIRIVAAAAAVTRDQTARLDRFSVPFARVNKHAERADPAATAQQFLEQVGSDYRRVSPAVSLSHVEAWRTSDEGAAALCRAEVQNRSVGPLAVGQHLDEGGLAHTFGPWLLKGFTKAPEPRAVYFVESFGDVLGPIVECSGLRDDDPERVAASHWQSRVGNEWANAFLKAGAEKLLADTTTAAAWWLKINAAARRSYARSR